jgi:hypothetical protein
MKRLTSIALVSGSGQFPADMLRRDKCYPVSESDAMVMADTFKSHFHGKWAIRMATDNGHWTDGRWASFGCTIIVES